MLEEIRLPEIGENVTSGTVVGGVHVQVGDAIEVDDPVIELETDKAVVDIPSPLKGQVTEILVARVPADQRRRHDRAGGNRARPQRQRPKGRMPAAGQCPRPRPQPPNRRSRRKSEAEREPRRRPGAAGRCASPAPGSARSGRPSGHKPPQPVPESDDGAIWPVPAAPSVRRLARELGVDVLAVAGSGPGGRITEADVKAFVRRSRPAPKSPADPPLPDFTRWGEVETVPLATVRRLTAESTALSWRTVPHVTQFDRADITALEGFIRKKARTGGPQRRQADRDGRAASRSAPKRSSASRPSTPASTSKSAA